MQNKPAAGDQRRNPERENIFISIWLWSMEFEAFLLSPRPAPPLPPTPGWSRGLRCLVRGTVLWWTAAAAPGSNRDVFRQDKDYAVAAVGPAGLRCSGSLHRRHGATRAPGSRQRQEAGGGEGASDLRRVATAEDTAAWERHGRLHKVHSGPRQGAVGGGGCYTPSARQQQQQQQRWRRRRRQQQQQRPHPSALVRGRPMGPGELQARIRRLMTPPALPAVPAVSSVRDQRPSVPPPPHHREPKKKRTTTTTGDVEQLAPPTPARAETRLPEGWRTALTGEEQEWIGRALFRQNSGGSLKLTTDLKLWSHELYRKGRDFATP
ncbi:unnamed protein product [Gadus morhua 'NCC']